MTFLRIIVVEKSKSGSERGPLFSLMVEYDFCILSSGPRSEVPIPIFVLRCMRFPKDGRKQSSRGNISIGPSENFYLSHLSASGCLSLPLDSNLLELFPSFLGIKRRESEKTV